MALCTLGCPAEYHAVIHWRCGADVFMPVENLTSIQFSRNLNDTSKATIRITKDSLDDVCCGNLGLLEPWLHELSIYRDNDLVWQGPVMTITETRVDVTVEAWDLSAWLARTVNFSTKVFAQGEADVSAIARYYIDWNMLYSAYSCTHMEGGLKVDHACLTNYIVRTNVNATPAYKPQEEVKYVSTIMEELVKFGLYWTFMGRRLVLGRKPGPQDLPVAQLSTDDLMGDFQIVRDGQAFATRAVATNSSSEEDRQTVTTGRGCNNPYGRVDFLVSSTDVPKCDCGDDFCQNPDKGPCRGSGDCNCHWETNKESINCQPANDNKCKDCVAKCKDRCLNACHAAQRAALLVICNNELKGRYPVPIAISVSDGAALHPEAPICFSQLVPGYRIDMRIDRACRNVQQAFVLAQMSVTWDAGGEKVSIGLTPLDAPGVDPNQNPPQATKARAAGAEQAALWWERGQLPPPPRQAVALAERAAP